MKRILVFAAAVLTLMFGVYIIINKTYVTSDQQELTIAPASPIEAFILEYLLAKDGTIRTNFSWVEEKEGKHRLSESIGLWLTYLYLKEDHEAFEQTVRAIEKNFLLHNGLVAWRIYKGEPASTNALIDDLRIIRVLVLEGESINRKEYITLAKKMFQAIMTYHQKDNLFIDFYDLTHKYANDSLTLSYLNISVFKRMEAYGLFPEESLHHLLSFMNQTHLDNGFYPKTYQLKQEQFLFDEEINLIDQLYVAIYWEDAEVETDPFYQWLKSTYKEDGLLYGRYDRKTKEPSVSYESSAVYGLAIIYALQKEDYSFAKELYKRMTTLRVNNETHSYVGGFVNVENHDTHSFDNLLPLIAERILSHEKFNVD